MTTKLQVAIDCADPERLARFWAGALGYKVEDPPAGFDTWRAYWLSQGVPEEELGEGDCSDSVVDPAGVGPRIWFQQVPEGKRDEPRTDAVVPVTASARAEMGRHTAFGRRRLPRRSCAKAVSF
jgi:hypothetical protein